MKLLRIPRAQFITMYNNDIYKQLFFGNLISSTADADSVPTWDENATYNFLDVVKIPALQMNYKAKKDNPQGYPPISRDWFGEGANPYKMLDPVFSSQSIFSNTCELEFNVAGMTHLLGRGIENAKEVFFEYFDFNGNVITDLFDCDSCNELESVATMTYDDNFDCFSCCNPDPIAQDSFAIRIPKERCEQLYKIKVTITKSDANLPIKIGTMVVAKEFNLGCAAKGFQIIDSTPTQSYDYPTLRATGIYHANRKTRMRGTLRLDETDVDQHRKEFGKHGSWLNYYLFDERDAVKSGLVLGIANDITYTFGSQYTTIGFECVGTEH